LAYWLASKRDGQDFDHIQRFDPRFWTVDFPRPTMASVVTTSADSMRVDLEFHHADALAGLIWDSVDRFDHPLLAYETNRDYSRSTLQFRWRSFGVVPLDQVHGPTLTVEGRDAAGQSRSWYVRLWNYATGSPEDATIELRFSELFEGWDVSSGPVQVHPTDIDRMFISLAPAGYAADNPTLLPVRVGGWAELSEIRCQGERCLLEIGDILLPPHELRMATAYDDSYNQTPDRILRNLRGLGYRGDVVHYVGMSHYFRLIPNQRGRLLVDTSGAICGPCSAWHASFLQNCARGGYQPIISLSYEIFDEHCPEPWKQRFFDGSPALTGWVPPSTLVSPANTAAMDYLRAVAGNFVAMVLDAGLPVAFQIGEPGWWQSPDRRICLYDKEAAEDFARRMGFDPPEIADLAEQMSDQQRALLDEAGRVLGESVLSIRDKVKQIAGDQAQVLVLLFTPTILGSEMADAYRANVPVQWAWPQFDRLQLEDYDWLTGGAEALRRQAYEQMQERLGYPLHKQDYLAGFVLRAEDGPAYWKRIDAGIEEAKNRGVDRCFVWALPQVTRDGFTRLPSSGDTDEMQAFDDVLYPLSLGRDASVSPEFSTSVSVTASGHERRNSHWTDARLRFDVGPGIRSEEELGTLVAFFRVRRGAPRGFRVSDPFDFSSNGMSGAPTPGDQLLGLGDGLTATYQLLKRYGDDDPQIRAITRPRPGSVRVSVGGIEVFEFAVGPGGKLLFREAPPTGSQVRAGFLFDVPVRFAEDRLDITGAAFAAGEAPSVPLIEIREMA
jgi:uncharacterized protein (TIGR02217 family)